MKENLPSRGLYKYRNEDILDPPTEMGPSQSYTSPSGPSPGPQSDVNGSHLPCCNSWFLESVGELPSGSTGDPLPAPPYFCYWGDRPPPLAQYVSHVVHRTRGPALGGSDDPLVPLWFLLHRKGNFPFPRHPQTPSHLRRPPFPPSLPPDLSPPSENVRSVHTLEDRLKRHGSPSHTNLNRHPVHPPICPRSRPPQKSRHDSPDFR